MLALVADRRFFVRAVSLGPQGIRRARFGPPPPPQPRRAPSPDPPPPPPPRPGRRPATSAAPTRSMTARGPSQSSPGGATARRRSPARPRLPSLARNGRPAAHSGPAAHCSRCPICPQPTCPSPSHAHLIGCWLVAGGADRRRSSGAAWAGSGGPRSACGASLLVPLGCLPRQHRFSCLFQPFPCRFPSLQRRLSRTPMV